MHEILSYDELYQKYQELQFRVTRFSSIEQELINTRDRLDQELVVYKRLNNFNSEALRCNDIQQFLQLVAESIIDIFEIEIGYANFKYESKNLSDHPIIALEGGSLLERDIHEEMEFLIDRNIIGSKAKLFDREELVNYLPSPLFNSCIISKKIRINRSGDFVIAGAIGSKMALNYNDFDNRSVTLFTVFLQQCEVILNNILTIKRNLEQIEQINLADRELKKLSMIATRTKSGVIITDKFGRVEWVNESFTTTTGYLLDEIIGLKPKDFLQTDDPNNEHPKKMLSEALRLKQGIELTIQNKTKEGNIYYNLLEITPIFDDSGELLNFIAIQKNISEEVHYKKQLEDINSRFELVNSAANIGIWENDLINKKVSWNDVMYHIYDIKKSENYNLFNLWREVIDSEDFEKMSKNIDLLVQGEIPMFFQEYSVCLPYSKNQNRFFRSFATTERDENNRIMRVLGTTQDITEGRTFELKILEKNEELLKINRELDQFVYSVSHDLRSPLLSIKGILTLIESSPSDEEKELYFSLIGKSISRLDTTILEILDFARNARLEQEYTEYNFSVFIKDIFVDMEFISDDPIDLLFSCESSEMVFLDKPRLGILMKNIIANGIKYRKKSEENSFVHVLLNEDESNYFISVKDNGEGISDKNKLKVFEMFYRASSSSTGTGLGLYICQDIVRKMNGSINLNSELGIGTEIKITLPKIKI